MSQRPENIAPPEIFYNADEARKYTSNSHMIDTQARSWSHLTAAHRCLGAIARAAGSRLADHSC